MNIDELDSKIIDILMQNAVVSSAVLARQLNVDSSTVRRRMKRLLDEKIIRITASPNLEKLGVAVVAFMSLEVSHEKLKPVLEELSKQPRAAWIGATSGRFNVRTVWWLNSTEELYSILESEIGRLDGILRTETSICLQIVKSESTSFKEILK